MAESEGIQEVVNQRVVQAATAVMITLRGVDMEPYLAQTASLRQPQQQMHGEPALEKPSYNWNTQDWYVELLIFETEVTEILEKRHISLLIRKIPSDKRTG